MKADQKRRVKVMASDVRVSLQRHGNVGKALSTGCLNQQRLIN